MSAFRIDTRMQTDAPLPHCCSNNALITSQWRHTDAEWEITR